jgi:hypothetical protein
LASLTCLRPMQLDATRSRRLPLVVGFTWDGSHQSGLHLASSRRTASSVSQGGVYVRVGDVLAVIKAAPGGAAGPASAPGSSLGRPARRTPGHTRRARRSTGLTGSQRSCAQSHLSRLRLSSSQPPPQGRSLRASLPDRLAPNLDPEATHMELAPARKMGKEQQPGPMRCRRYPDATVAGGGEGAG